MKKASRRQWQKEEEQKNAAKIIIALLDKEPHQYKELLEKTRLSKATLSKHLRKMGHTGTVSREMDTKSGQYPYPVYYTLVGRASEFEREWHDAIIEPLKRTDLVRGKNKAGSVSFFMEYLNVQIGLQFLGNLRNYFDKRTENVDSYILAFYQEGTSILKEKLEEASAQGVNVQALIGEAEQKMLKHFKHLQKER
jgi:DNA-binding HxlR family transcriptional regulator